MYAHTHNKCKERHAQARLGTPLAPLRPCPRALDPALHCSLPLIRAIESLCVPAGAVKADGSRNAPINASHARTSDGFIRTSSQNPKGSGTGGGPLARPCPACPRADFPVHLFTPAPNCAGHSSPLLVLVLPHPSPLPPFKFSKLFFPSYLARTHARNAG